MGFSVMFNSARDNVGTTTLSLFIAQRLVELTNCKILYIDMNKRPTVKSFLKDDLSTNNLNIDNILSYCVVEDIKLEPIIKANITIFNHSRLEIIYGTNLLDSLIPTRIKVMLDKVTNYYDLIICDYGKSKINDEIMKKVDMNIVTTLNKQSDIKELVDGTYMYEKSILLINECDKVSNLPKNIKALNMPFNGEINSLKDRGIINLRQPSSKLDEICEYIISKFNLEKIKKKSFFKK